jgi:uncharacterized membrane protein YoaK (UPF0700 family)
MTRYDRRLRTLAVCLAALAGYVDALGFLQLGGFFVSFMSGNSTQLGVGLVRGGNGAATAGALVASFVVGVICGSLAGKLSKTGRRRNVLLLVALFLATASVLYSTGSAYGALFMMVLAMGAENAVFEKDGEVTIGLTYMTGTLVKLGQHITGALFGGNRLAWVLQLLLWLGLIVGATAGAAVYPALGLGGLWVAAGLAFILAIVAGKISTDEQHAG